MEAKVNDEMPEKIPDDIIIKDLLRIKGENEAYIQELEDQIKHHKSFTPPNPYKKQLKANEKTIEKHKKKILELQGEIVDYRRRLDAIRSGEIFKPLTQLMKDFETRNNFSIVVEIHQDGSGNVQEFWSGDEIFLCDTSEQMVEYLNTETYELDENGRAKQKPLKDVRENK